MKAINPDLQAHLDAGVTTLAYCWRLETRDGTVLGFTDHDQDLAFASVTYRAATGFSASAIESSLGLAVDNLEAAGALSADALTEADLTNGLYDDAAIEIWRVNWEDPEQRVLLRAGNLGEVTRGAAAFSAEVRGLSRRLNQPMGRLFQYGCDADLGDARCGVDLETSAFKSSGSVDAVIDERRFSAAGLAGFASDWFAGGLLRFDSGANDGARFEVKSHRRDGGTASLTLWERPARPAAPGDSFTVTAGCDKQARTCREKFANLERFRGFPHMPGNDFVQSYPNRGDDNDGGRRGSGS